MHSLKSSLCSTNHAQPYVFLVTHQSCTALCLPCAPSIMPSLMSSLCSTNHAQPYVFLVHHQSCTALCLACAPPIMHSFIFFFVLHQSCSILYMPCATLIIYGPSNHSQPYVFLVIDQSYTSLCQSSQSEVCAILCLLSNYPQPWIFLVLHHC